MKKRLYLITLLMFGLLFVVSCNKDESINDDININDEVPHVQKELSYSLLVDDTYMVTGVGECLYNEIVIPSEYNGKKVTRIGSNAFKNCEYLTSVTIPNSIISIGNSSFYGCTGLTNVEIPNSVIKIETQAFRKCKNLLSLTISESVTNVGSDAFYECYRLVEIYNLSQLNLNRGLSDFGCVARYAKVIHKTIDEESQLIKNNDGFVFINDKNDYYLVSYPEDVKELTLPSSINGHNYKINDYAFYEDNNITKVILSSGVVGIEEYSFYSCDNLFCIIISEGVTSIGYGAFSECYKLVEIYNLSSLNIIINSTGFGDVSRYAIVIHTSIEEKSNLIVKDEYVFLNDNSNNYYLVSYIGSEEELTLPNNINGKNYVINDYAFYMNEFIKKVVIPNGVTNINSYAFYSCSSLTSITLPESLEDIGYLAFIGCMKLVEVYNLSSVIIEKDSTDVAGAIGVYAILIHTSLNEKSGLITTNDGYVFIYDETDYYLVGFYGKKSELILPTSINGNSYKINKGAFWECSYLENVIIPNGVTSIGVGTFANCDNLKSVEILSNITTIGSVAFAESSITSILIPKSVKKIEQFAFSESLNLTNVYYTGTPSDWTSIVIEDYNDSLDMATIYYYSETEPFDTTNKYWHYVDGVITIWE